VKSISEKKLIINLLEEILYSLSKSRIGYAIDRISLGIVVGRSRFLDKLKQKGILRHSTYIDKKDPVAGISKHILKHKSFFCLSESETLYFESLIHLDKYSIELKKVYKDLCAYIRAYRPQKVNVEGHIVETSLVKSLLVINELFFLKRKESPLGSLRDVNDQSLSLEENCEAISYLVWLIGVLTPSKPFNLFIDEEFLKKNRHVSLIQSANRLRTFRDLEIQIETLGYVCQKESSLLRITHKEPNFLKSMALSDIFGEGQKDADAWGVYEFFNGYPTISSLASIVHEQFPNAIQYQLYPFPRFTFLLPTAFFEIICKEIIGYYYEEVQGLQYVAKELSISEEALTKFVLVDGFTMNDFLYVHRIFTILQYVYSEYVIKRISGSNYYKLLSSLLVIWDEERLVGTFESIVSRDKILNYLDIMSWNFDGDAFLDLQYTPILSSNDFYVICLSVLRHSRATRNIIASLAKSGKNVRGNQMDLISQGGVHLAKAFAARGFSCFIDQKIYYKGETQREGDIDFLGVKDDTIFICECKDVMDATDSFEYRRINDYLMKAGEQLKYIQSAISDPNYQVDLGRRLNIDFSKIIRVVYLIVPSSRRIFGHHISGYPVRHVHELINFLDTGIWKFKLPDGDVNVFHLWKADSFELSDLVEYCGIGSPHSELFAAMYNVEEQFSQRMIRDKYALSLNDAITNLSDSYRVSTEEFLKD
jgi:hypothetical protein